MKMQKTLMVQRRNGLIEEMPEEMALDLRLQKKHGWRVITIPTTVEELKAEVYPFEEVNEDGVELGETIGLPDTVVKKRGRKPKQ